MRELTGGQVQEVLDRLLYSALQPIVLHSKLFDSTLLAILSLTTVNRKRKIATASRNKETNRKCVIDKCCRVFVVDAAERFEIIKSLGIERNIVSVFIANFLKHKEAFLQLYNSKNLTQDQSDRLDAICRHMQFTDLESLYVAFIRSSYFLDLYTKYVGMLVNEYTKLCQSMAAEAAASNPNIDKADLHQKLLFGVYTGINKYISNNGALTAYLKWWLLNARNSYGDYEYGVAYVIPQAKRKELTDLNNRVEVNYSVSLDDSVNDEGVSRYDVISDSTDLVDEQTYESVNAIISKIAKRVDGENGIGRLVMPISEYYSPVTYKRMLRHMRSQGNTHAAKLLRNELRRLKVSGFDTIEPNSGKDSVRLEDIVEIHALTAKTWEDMRFLSKPILPIKRHWINIVKKNGDKTSLPKLCLAHDPSKPGGKSGVECPYCALEHGDREKGASASVEFFYLAQAIIRDLQEDRPARASKQKLSPSERKTGHKDISSKTWTPVRPVRLTSGCAAKLKSLKDRNKIKGKTFAVDHDKYGIDVALQYDPDQAGAAKYSVDRGERSPLTKEEMGYLTWDLGSKILDKIGLESLEEAEAWLQRTKIVGKTKVSKKSSDKKRGRRDDDMELGSKKSKSKRSRLDADDEPRRKKSSKSKRSRLDDDDEPRRKKSSRRDADKPRTKKSSSSKRSRLDDDEPRRTKKRSSSSSKKRRSRD